MRRSTGEVVELFNGRDGSWLARITQLTKRTAIAEAFQQTAPQRDAPDIWMCFAPIKKARTDFIVEKATELGAAQIVPVQTAHTNSERIRRERLQAHAIEAAEQCGGNFVPEIRELTSLERLLPQLEGRRVLWADEAAAGPATAFSGLPKGPWAILTGPEGGFSEAERNRLRGMEQVTRISLGPRILRADTAAVAAMTLWQAALGDWA